MKSDKPKRIVLVVDDDIQVQHFLKRQLKSFFDKVIVAGSPQEALHELETIRPTHLVSDFDFGPGMNGIDFIVQAVKKHPEIEMAMIFTGSEIKEFPPEVDSVISKSEGNKKLLEALVGSSSKE